MSWGAQLYFIHMGWRGRAKGRSFQSVGLQRREKAPCLDAGGSEGEGFRIQ